MDTNINTNISYIKLFNGTVDEFFNDLIEIFPDSAKIKVSQSLFQTVCSINIKKACIDFMTRVFPFLEQIIMKDSVYFYTMDSKPKIFEQLSILWTPDLPESIKCSIWKYIYSLVAIGSKVIEVPPEYADLINYIIISEN